MQKETKFKIKVQGILKKIPDLYVVKIQQVALRGIPDLFICYKGKFVAWELKDYGKSATNLQAHELNKISKAGGIARVVTPETLSENIRELLSENRS